MKLMKKILSRPADVSTLIDYNLGIGIGLYEKVNAGFKTALFVLKNGAMVEYRAEYEEEKLKEVFLDLFFDGSTKIKPLMLEFEKKYEKLGFLVGKSKQVNEMQSEEVINLIKEFIVCYREVWYPVMVMYWVPLWVEESKLTDEEKGLLQEMIKARYDKDKEYVYAQFFFDNIYGYIKDKFDLNADNLGLLSPQELITLIKIKGLNDDLSNKIMQRKEGCFIYQGQVYDFNELEEINQFLKEQDLKINFEKEVPLGDIVKGQVAYSGGKIRGKVKLLFSKEDMQKIEEGDIIVSPMTTPYFDSVIKRAAAIVTDEGGITCHAAIVSRELKILCIIGTKVATKVFKDGDLVEVDADKGIVRKINP